MRPTWPLILMTGLQGLAGGVFVTLALLGWVLSPAAFPDSMRLGLALVGLVLVAGGGVASIFHMHRLAGARFILRRLRTSWLSREVVTTGLTGLAAAVTALVPLVAPEGAGWYTTTALVTAVLALLAMAVTAMIYATIPAMLTWHTPLTVLAMMGTGLVSGAVWVRAAWDMTGGARSDSLGFAAVLWAALVVWGIVKAMQWQVFRDARSRVRAETGLGLPRGPYRLRDTGTTRAPYRTQPQVWPMLPRRQRQALTVGLGALSVAVGVSAAWRTPVAGLCGAVAAAGMVYVERWLFFADATHSSRIWFPTSEPAAPSAVRPSPSS